MHKYRDVLGQVGRLAAVEAVCVAVILAVYFFLGGMTVKVLLGALIGGAMSVAHFLVLSVSVCKALDCAKSEEEAARVRVSIQASASMRLLVMAVILIVLFKMGVCDPVAALVPLLCAQLALKFIGLFQGGKEDAQ
ncbi:ATP synthase subunit I [uncultured Gemmiger sp.]|uniref:ATP synthase subunit I n=1 Tax=uncultured Gemmiger sp. TaxID=1623490 RepID=UPI0025D2E051|nr:ATP synthase subunit I [uncultured Gemmiger sp.]